MMVTETPKTPLEIVQADVLFWGGLKILTVLDLATRFIFAKCLSRKTGQAVREALLTFIGTVGTPKRLVTDPGREFRNRQVEELLAEFQIQPHITTPGHARSHGAIERVHGTLSEHLNLLELGRGITGPEAVLRAVLAYNHSIHSATGKMPIELMRAWQRENPEVPISQELEEIGAREGEKKENRVQKTNVKRRGKVPGRLGVGKEVFIKNLVRRCKNDPKYLGPYTITQMLDRNRLKLERVGGTRGRYIVRHVNEVKLHAKSRR
jgi:hypothetical protein